MVKLNVTITEIIKETSDVKTFRLKFNNGEGMPFLPGQFIMVALESNPKIAKAYSISSSSEDKEFLEITVKIYSNGKFSPLLDKAKVGDILIINGPFGHFNYRKDMGDKLVLIYGGAGIAPFRSIIKTVADNKWDTEITLIGCYKKPEDIIYKEEMSKWKIKNIVTITRPETSKIKWEDHTGRIDKKLIEQSVDNKDALFYLCGPNEMVDSMRGILASIGVNKENIKFERWG